MNTRKIIWWSLAILVVLTGLLVWRSYNQAVADVVNKPTVSVPDTVSFFGTISVVNNAVPLNKIMVYAGSSGTPVQANGEFSLLLSRDAWRSSSDQFSSQIRVRFFNGDTGQELAVKDLSEPYTLNLPSEWSNSSNIATYNSANSYSYVPSSSFSIKADFILSNGN